MFYNIQKSLLKAKIDNISIRSNKRSTSIKKNLSSKSLKKKKFNYKLKFLSYIFFLLNYQYYILYFL